MFDALVSFLYNKGKQRKGQASVEKAAGDAQPCHSVTQLCVEETTNLIPDQRFNFSHFENE